MIEPPAYSLLYGLFAALIGGVVGSFCATAAIRIARGEFDLTGRSRCDACCTQLTFFNTVPILSFAFRRGACGTCGARIPLAHLIGEVAGALGGVSTALVSTHLVQALLLAVLLSSLLTAAIIDSWTLRLPDAASLAVSLSGAALEARRSFTDLWVGLMASVLTFIVLEAVRRVFLDLRRRPGLGFGDVKLAAALAIWTGDAASWSVALAAFLGLGAFALLRPSDGRLPFGPWLALGGALVGLVREGGLWPLAA